MMIVRYIGKIWVRKCNLNNFFFGYYDGKIIYDIIEEMFLLFNMLKCLW